MTSRMKERGGGGGKVMALQVPHRPALDGTPKGKVTARRAPSAVREHLGRTPVPGKENPRAISRGKVAPEGAQVGDKVHVAPGSVRLSTSSMPRGKGSGSSDFARLMADFRARGGAPGRFEGREKVSSREVRNVDPAAYKTEGRFQQPRKNVNCSDTVAFDGVTRLADGRKSGNTLNLNSRRSVSRARGSNLEKIGEKTLNGIEDESIASGNVARGQKKVFSDTKECSLGKFRVAQRLESDGVRKGFNLKENKHDSSTEESHKKFSENVVPARVSSKVVASEVTVSKILLQKESDGGKAAATSIRLQEKLAYLEGKVQRIASDIKRTKDMLESNDPTASKLLVSDIQSKISGIEEVVSHVMGSVDPESTVPFSKVKDFNPEELEARFFPHHKLLRNRTSSVSEMIIKDGSLSPVEENPIALEFLASLEVKNPNSTDSVEIQRTGPGISVPSDSQNLLTHVVTDSRDKCIASILAADEKLEDFDDQENKTALIPEEEIEDPALNQLFEIGSKSSTGGWFVSEGEAALLAHSDGSCSYFDIANNEGKAVYNPPVEVSSNLWGDCWLIRAPGVDGCAGRYAVAASAGGNSLGSGFCSWDYYSRKVSAFRIEEGKCSTSSALARGVIAPLSSEHQWWYRPCGPLLVAASAGQRKVNAFDIRDGEVVMSWNLHNPAAALKYSSPLQWRSRGKVVIVESETVRLWDVNALSPQPLLSIAAGKKVNALHVSNTDAELGGGVRQRISSSEVEGNDGAFSTDEEVNVVDLRLPSGIGLKIPKKLGINAEESIFSRGDSVYLGCSESTAFGSVIHQFSLRKGKMAASYKLPKVNSQVAVTQVWGNSKVVMGVCGMGLFVFDDISNEGVDSCEVFGPEDLYCPSFDFLGSRVLLISRDRPAMWRYL